MIVRQATESDWGVLMRFVSNFFNSHNLAKLEIGFNADCISQLVKKLTKEHIMLVLEADDEIVGGVGGIITPFLFNANAKIFQEIFFYVKDGFRKYSQMLLAELEEVCKQLKLGKIIMAHPDDGNLEKMERFYKARGFKKLETHFIKRI